MRIFAIGDIHGYLEPLKALINSVSPAKDDLLVFLGDYVDKGPDVMGVIDYLLELNRSHRTVFLRGNHDQLMIDAYRNPAEFSTWECIAGDQPLSSYGVGTTADLLQRVPAEHWAFLETTCRNFFETPEFIFVHGGIRLTVDPADEEPDRLQWMTLSTAEPHHSGRTVICGHSAQESGKIADLGHTICVDTGIAHGGSLSCLALDTFEFWQVDEDGASRTGKLWPDVESEKTADRLKTGGTNALMKDLSNPRLIKLKGGMFLFTGIVAAGLIIFENPAPRTILLLGIAIWSFCRAYYFAFYVIEHYVDPSFKFSGLGSALKYLLGKPRKPN